MTESSKSIINPLQNSTPQSSPTRIPPIKPTSGQTVSSTPIHQDGIHSSEHIMQTQRETRKNRRAKYRERVAPILEKVNGELEESHSQHLQHGIILLLILFLILIENYRVKYQI